MSKISRAASKARFRTGMYPTQADFENLHDSYVHKDDTIPLEQVGTNGATVVSLLNQKANSSHTHEIADVNGLQAFITKVNTFLGTVDASDETINRWKELEAFLQGITDTETLTGLLAALKSEIEGNLSIDATLSSTSEHALQNKVLYNELRITESGSVNSLIFTPTNTEYEAVPILNISANDLRTIVVDGTSVYLLPDSSEAYNISDTDGKTFGITGDNDATLFKFDSTNVRIVNDVDSTIRLQEFASVTTSDYIRFELGSELNFDETLYVPIGTLFVNGTVSGGTGTTTVKSLKQKIAELEARLAAVPTNYLEVAFDMSAYASAEVGKVLLYLGATTQDFTHCYFYEKTASGWKNARVSPVIQ